MGTTVEVVEVYWDQAGEWRWKALAPNGRTVAVSGEGYVNRAHALEQATDLFPVSRVELVGDAFPA